MSSAAERSLGPLQPGTSFPTLGQCDSTRGPLVFDDLCRGKWTVFLWCPLEDERVGETTTGGSYDGERQRISVLYDAILFQPEYQRRGANLVVLTNADYTTAKAAVSRAAQQQQSAPGGRGNVVVSSGLNTASARIRNTVLNMLYRVGPTTSSRPASSHRKASDPTRQEPVRGRQALRQRVLRRAPLLKTEIQRKTAPGRLAVAPLVFRDN
ncbi:unnamed protein product [Amoebophrya sp. A25]|nr:unnamed protein product [Amoebophrya sp. A25]|eukprot:GSA25T00007260001.1